jgi:hypothetical protein
MGWAGRGLIGMAISAGVEGFGGKEWGIRIESI